MKDAFTKILEETSKKSDDTLRYKPISHFGDKSFQAITCTGTDNSKQNKQRKCIKTQNKLTGPR